VCSNVVFVALAAMICSKG